MSQDGLARRLGVTKGAIEHWEHDRYQPNLARLIELRKLCKRLAVRRNLDGLIRAKQLLGARPAATTSADLPAMQRENKRLLRDAGRLHASLLRTDRQITILRDLVAALERERLHV